MVEPDEVVAMRIWQCSYSEFGRGQLATLLLLNSPSGFQHATSDFEQSVLARIEMNTK